MSRAARAAARPNLTKVWIGRHWWYIDTNRRFPYREQRLFGRYIGILSYKKAQEP